MSVPCLAFRCPHPNCGREFNVNSNMRRHYRNHARTNPSRGHGAASKPARRRMEQISPSIVGVSSIAGRDYTGVLSFPLAQLHSPSDDSGGDDGDDRMRSEYSDSEWERDLDDAEDTTAAEAHMQNQQGGDGPDSDSSGRGTNYRQQGSDESFRQQGNGLESPTASSKRCKSRHPQHAKEPQTVSQTTAYPHSYTPSSAVYLQSCTDLNVSTVLRPAFSSRTPKEALILA